MGGDTVAPKSIVREMYERAMTFGEYVNDYGLKRSEGVVLRYLSDVYKGLVQNVPEDLRDARARRHGGVARRGRPPGRLEPDRRVGAAAAPRRAAVRWRSVDDLRPTLPTGERTIVDDHRAFRVMVRNKVFDWVQKLARRRGYDEIVADANDRDRWQSGEDVIEAMAPYRDEFGDVLDDATARSGELFRYDRSTGRVTQILHDPEDSNEWRIEAIVDLDASREDDRVVLRLVEHRVRCGEAQRRNRAAPTHG